MIDCDLKESALSALNFIKDISSNRYDNNV